MAVAVPPLKDSTRKGASATLPAPLPPAPPGLPALHATLPCPRLAGPEDCEAAEEDSGRLCAPGSAAVRLDLRGVAYFDSRFAGLLIRLRSSLAAAGRRLTVQAPPNIEQVFRTLRLDRLFEEISGPGSTAQAAPAERGPADDRGRTVGFPE